MRHGCHDPATSNSSDAMAMDPVSGLPAVGDHSGDLPASGKVLSTASKAIYDTLDERGGAVTEDELVEILAAHENGLAAWAALRAVRVAVMVRVRGEVLAALDAGEPVPVFPDARS